MRKASGGSPGNPDDDGRGKKKRRVTRRLSLIPLPSAARLIHPLEERVVFNVIALAEAATKAEAARSASSKLSINAAMMPSYGEDISHLLPTAEYRRLIACLNAQSEDLRARLIVLMWLGREYIKPTPATMKTLLERAYEMLKDASSYLAGKCDLAQYLRRGLAKLHDGENRQA
jgi:hypothetical protein